MRKSPLPTRDRQPSLQSVTLAWVGVGEAHVWKNDEWRRVETQDYEFNVLQRRYDTHWESVKLMNRRHPDYDGSAGARDQVHYFELRAAAESPDMASIRIASSMGCGGGKSDREFRRFSFELKTGASGLAAWLTPYDTLRFEQTYLYEAGKLEEEIILTKAATSSEKRFYRIRESATVFINSPLPGPPTIAA